MAGTQDCQTFEDDMYSALSQIVARGSTVPAELRPLWEHAQSCVDCLARVEEELMWDEQLRLTVREARASLFLSLSLVAATWHLHVRRRAAWVKGEGRISTRAATRQAGVTATVLEYEGWALEVVPGTGVLEVNLYSREFAVDGVTIRVLDAQNRCVACEATDVFGHAMLSVPPATAYDFTIEPPRPVL